MSLIAGGMGTLALTMQTASDHCRGQTLGAQHGRMLSARIRTAVERATASESFPGCAVFSEAVGNYTFPETLVIWSPPTAAAAPNGLPRVNELVVYCPDPTQPNRLLEIRDPSNTNAVPGLSSTSAWHALLTNLKTGNSAQRTVLSNLLHTANASDSAVVALRGCIRFHTILAPTAAQFSSYRSGSDSWGDLDWPLHIYGARSGMRQVVCQFELQLDPGNSSAAASQASVPCFGSAVFHYPLAR